MEEQWEYCRLFVSGRLEVKGNYKYDVSIAYMEGGESVRFLSTTDSKGKVYTYNVFHVAMGYLGLFGWELVSVQHGHNGVGLILSNNCVAYFRRKVKPERAIDFPPLILP